MEMNKYIKESKRTAMGGDLDRKDFPTNVALLQEMVALDLHGSMADALKRSLFYSDDLHKRVEKQRLRINEAADKVIENHEKVGLNFTNELLHSALGIASEAGEMFEEYVSASLENREVNKVNLVEEAGDVMWYLAMMLRELDVSFEEVAEKNIAKLAKRFPDKFTKEKALNRNLEAEEKALAG